MLGGIMTLKQLLKRFGLDDNGRWRICPSVTGPKAYFWFNRDLHGRKTWIVWDRIRNDYVVDIK